MASAASSSRSTSEATYPATRHSVRRDKGKGRATSPELMMSFQAQSHAEKDKQKSGQQSQANSLSFDSQSSPENHLLSCSDEDLLTTPESFNSANTKTPPFMVTESAGTPPPWLEESAAGEVSIDLGDPFTFDPFDSNQDHQSPLGVKAAAISTNMATRRRTFQSGVARLSLQESEPARLSRIDRASIFSGLRTSTPHSLSTTLPETVSKKYLLLPFL